MRSSVLISLLITSLVSLDAHVVFEEIGTMAGATSYIHVALEVDLGQLDKDIMEYTEGIARHRFLISQTLQSQLHDVRHGPGAQKDIQSRIKPQLDRYDEHARINLQAAGHLKGRLRNLKGVLPTAGSNPVPSRTARSVPGMLFSLGRGLVGKAISSGGLGIAGKVVKQVSSPNIIFSLARGILGTFMGIFTQRQLSKLGQEVQGVKEQQAKIVEAVTANKLAIANLTLDIAALNATIAIQQQLDPSLMAARWRYMYDKIHAATDVAVHVVQQAQHHRLAVDLLSSDNLANLFSDLSDLALLNGCQLLPKLPSDLFQVEVSYFYDGEKLVLMLHVPMVPEGSLLRVLRLRPFPIPFSSEYALIPKPLTSLLALSQGTNRLMTTIEHSDLMGCHQVSNVYACERHGVLYKNLTATCLGSLFEQNIPAARQLCKLQLVPYQETILQLQNSWFLVYSPVMFTGYIVCQNGTSSEVHIRRAVNRVFVDATCFLDLKEHRLISEFSLQLETSIKHFAWENEDMSLFDLDEADIATTFDQTGIKGQGIFLDDVIKTRKRRFGFVSRLTDSSAWRALKQHFLFVSIALGVLGSIIAAAVFFGTNRFLHLKNRFRSLKQTIIQAIPHLTQNLNRLLHHFHLPQINLNPMLYPQLPHPPPDPVPLFGAPHVYE
jgi:hypothetical protein